MAASPAPAAHSGYMQGGATLYDLNGQTLKSKKLARIGKQRALYWRTKKNVKLIKRQVNF